MDTLRQQAIKYVDIHVSRFIDELSDFCAIPSVSTEPIHKKDMHLTAEWLENQLHKIGFPHTKIFATAGHPILYGEYLTKVPKAKTVLVYGHYDVQPADPLEKWISPPFIAEVRDGRLFARGASDMKGQIMASLIAIEAIIHQDNCPVNIKVIFEGEEEIGSPNLNDFLSTHIDLLSGDVSLNPDAGMISEDTPSITYGLRGLAFFELIVEGPDHDLHSGQFGGIINNPAQVLCELIAGMHDSKGRITLPGFYTDVRNVSEDETLELKRIKLTEDQIIDLTGTPSIWGETEYSPIERVTTRPTLEINGLISGYTGHGGKTIIPSTSMAKISFRLVPDQDPDDVHQQLFKYLEDHAPKTVRWYLSPMAGSPPTRINLNTPEIKAMADAMYSVWGKKPVYKREGGSIPVVTSMQKILGIESVLVGFGLPDDSIHSPNESLNLNTWIQGARSLVHFLYNLGSREDKA